MPPHTGFCSCGNMMDIGDERCEFCQIAHEINATWDEHDEETELDYDQIVSLYDTPSQGSVERERIEQPRRDCRRRDND